MKLESLWIYCKDKIHANDSDILNTKSLKYKTNITEKIPKLPSQPGILQQKNIGALLGKLAGPIMKMTVSLAKNVPEP